MKNIAKLVLLVQQFLLAVLTAGETDATSSRIHFSKDNLHTASSSWETAQQIARCRKVIKIEMRNSASRRAMNLEEWSPIQNACWLLTSSTDANPAMHLESKLGQTTFSALTSLVDWLNHSREEETQPLYVLAMINSMNADDNTNHVSDIRSFVSDWANLSIDETISLPKTAEVARAKWVGDIRFICVLNFLASTVFPQEDIITVSNAVKTAFGVGNDSSVFETNLNTSVLVSLAHLMTSGEMSKIEIENRFCGWLETSNLIDSDGNWIWMKERASVEDLLLSYRIATALAWIDTPRAHEMLESLNFQVSMLTFPYSMQKDEATLCKTLVVLQLETTDRFFRIPFVNLMDVIAHETKLHLNAKPEEYSPNSGIPRFHPLRNPDNGVFKSRD